MLCNICKSFAFPLSENSMNTIYIIIYVSIYINKAQYTLYIVQCTMYTVHCTLFNVQFTLYSVLYVYTVY